MCRVNRGTAYLTLSQQAKQFTTGNEIHDHVQVVDIAKRAPQVDQKRMSHPDEHLPFRVGMLDLLHAHDLFLVEDLDGVEATVVPGSNQVNAAKGARAEAVPWGRCRCQPLTEKPNGENDLRPLNLEIIQPVPARRFTKRGNGRDLDSAARQHVSDLGSL